MRIWILVAAAALFAVPTAAQDIGQIAAEYVRNVEALKDYRWTSKVEISIGGAVHGTRLYTVSYDDAGFLQHDRLEMTGDSKDLRRAEETLTRVRQMIYAYMQMKPEQVQKMFGDGSETLSTNEPGISHVRAHSVFHSNDVVSFWVGKSDLRLHRAEIHSAIQQQECVLSGDFADLESGPTYVARSVFQTDVTNKKGKPTGRKLTVVTENFDYRRR
jgi:hypothetical protein